MVHNWRSRIEKNLKLSSGFYVRHSAINQQFDNSEPCFVLMCTVQGIKFVSLKESRKVKGYA